MGSKTLILCYPDISIFHSTIILRRPCKHSVYYSKMNYSKVHCFLFYLCVSSSAGFAATPQLRLCQISRMVHFQTRIFNRINAINVGFSSSSVTTFAQWKGTRLRWGVSGIYDVPSWNKYNVSLDNDGVMNLKRLRCFFFFCPWCTP